MSIQSCLLVVVLVVECVLDEGCAVEPKELIVRPLRWFVDFATLL